MGLIVCATALLLIASATVCRINEKKCEDLDRAEEEYTSEIIPNIEVIYVDRDFVEGYDATEATPLTPVERGKKPTIYSILETADEYFRHESEQACEKFVDECKEQKTPVYICNDMVLDADFQEEMYKMFAENGIEWWYPYAIAMIYQESAFNFDAVHYNFDGSVDIGLFQFNNKWWDSECLKTIGYVGDIHNPYDQLAVYTANVARRSNIGHDISTIISDHKTGEAWYDSKYVNDVLQWIERMWRIE